MFKNVSPLVVLEDEKAKAFEPFIERVDSLIMGSATYDKIIELGDFPYDDMEKYVLTTQEYGEESKTLFTEMDIEELATLAKSKSEKNIWLMGGAKVVKQFIDYDLIDEFIITIVPMIIGTGIPLFLFSKEEVKLDLLSTNTSNGQVTLHYKRIK